MGPVPWSKGSVPEKQLLWDRSQSIFFIYLFQLYTTFYHRIVQIPRRVDPPQTFEIIFLIILMFQAITSIFHFFLENSFLLLDWDW